ncbi:MAG TPA: hypothetical protein VIX80_03905 [Candidatus Kapabacteria bacterium]
MTKHLYFLLLLAAVVSSCSEVTPLNQFQDIAEVQWKNDGSGMLSFIERANGDNGGTLSGAYSLYELNSDGSLGSQYETGTTAIQGFSFAIFMNDNGTKAITQMGAYDVYEIDIPSKKATKRITGLYLIAASNDGRFVVGTFSPPRQPIKTVSIFDMTSDSPRVVTQFDITGIKNNRGVWLDNGTFGVAVTDSIGYHISIYDTTGTMLNTIANADISNHNIHFDADSRYLYFRNNDGKVIRQNVATNERETVINKPTVQNFDVTADEYFVVYSILESDKGKMYKYYVDQRLEFSAITDDVLAGAYLSPLEDKLSYVHFVVVNQYDVKVIPFSK